MEPIIRHYQAEDQPEVFMIAADTAFFGAPVEAFLEDRRLFTDAFARYYTEFETSLVWVAETAGGVAGFLLGCANTIVQSKKWRNYILRKVLVHAVTGQYQLGRKTARFAWGMLMAILRGEEPYIDLNEYPAHLQIDVKAGYRGQGIGRQLIEAYIGQLRQMDVRGVHLETTSYNEAAWHLYEKAGFSFLDERINGFWTQMLGFEVKNRSYGKRLG